MSTKWLKACNASTQARHKVSQTDTHGYRKFSKTHTHIYTHTHTHTDVFQCSCAFLICIALVEQMQSKPQGNKVSTIPPAVLVFGCVCVYVLKSEQAYMLTCLREYEFRLYLSCECGVLCMGMGISVYVCTVLSVIDKTQWGVAEIQESHWQPVPCGHHAECV